MAITHQTAKTSYVNHADGQFAYRRFGASSGVPLLFLIHFRGTMDKWDPLLINSIAASRPIILVDYKGVGLSTGPAATSFRESASDIINFLAIIDVKEVDILGFSIGGFVAGMIGLDADPTKLKVRHLVLCGTGASSGPGIEMSTNDYMPFATRDFIDLVDFKTLFFAHNPAGAKHAEEWWARVQERTEATSGEALSNFLSKGKGPGLGYSDGGAGIGAQGAALEKWFNPETSQGLNGSYGRLGELNMPVLIANGSVSKTYCGALTTQTCF